MNNRSNFFFALAMAIVMMVLLQWIFPAPKKPVADQQNEQIAAEQVDGEDTGEGTSQSDPSDSDSNSDDADSAEETDDESSSEVKRKSIDAEITFLSDEEILERVAGETAETAEINAWAQERSLTSVRQMGDLVTIGSLYATGTDRYLITINPLGGTVRRIELNARDERTGKFKYKDLIWLGGYIGAIEAHNTTNGVRVGVVGPGTPADMAIAEGTNGGIRAGDILVSLNDEPITSAEEFGRMMAVTHPEDEVSVLVRRNGNEIVFQTTLSEKPIELIRPEPGVVDPTFVYDESFLMTLKIPSDSPRTPWQEIDPAIRDSQWEVNQVDENHVELTFEVAPKLLAENNLEGPITVVKRFGVPTLAESDVHSFDSKTWHWDFDFEIENGSAKAQDIGYELKGPTGTPSETWWYSQKTHGRASALFKIAGARDVLGSTAYRKYQFWGCPEIVEEAMETNGETQFLADPYESITNEDASKVNWLGVDTLYFNVTMFPKLEQGKTWDVYSAFAEINGGYDNGQTVAPKIPKSAREHKLVDCTFRVFSKLSLPADGSASQPFEIFSAPKDPDVLDQYGLGETRAFGWFWWCSKPLLFLMHLLYWATFGITYTLPIIIITCLVRSLMIPFSRRAALNAQMMQHLQPEIKSIKDKYPEDMQKQAQAQQALFKKYNYKPLGGCLMGFIQLPVFLGLYRGLSLDIALRDQPLFPGLSWCTNLSGPDQLMYWKNLSPSWLGESGWFGPFLNILPLVTMCLFLLQQKMFTPPATDENQKMMQKMMSFMMLFMAIMFFKVPAGLCVYFVTSSLWAIVEKKLLPKPELDTTKFDDVDKGPSMADKGMALLGRGKKPSQQDQARQQAEERKQRNRERNRKLNKKKK